MTEPRAIIVANERIVPFQVFQDHCDERRFVYTGKPGSFNVLCKLKDCKCNRRNCPIWNSKRVADIPENMMSLRGVNLALRSQGGEMDELRMKRFMKDQREAIKEHKRKKEKEAGKDLGYKPIYEWIESQGEEFRRKWVERNR